MSFMNLYDTQFVRSREGITPVVLSDDENIYDIYGTRSSQVKQTGLNYNWHCFQGLIGVSETELLDEIKTLIGCGYDEYWRYKSKSVDGAGVMRWARTNIKAAAYIEDILRANHTNGVSCSLSTWRGDTHSTHLLRNAKTTEEFDVWVSDVKIFCEEFNATKGPADFVFPVVTFWTGMEHPKPVKSVRSIIKTRYGYFCNFKMNNDGSKTIVASNSIEDATIFEPDEVQNVVDELYGMCVYKIRVMDAKVKEQRLNATTVIYAKNPADENQHGYLIKQTSTKMRYIEDITQAHRYLNITAAENAKKRLLRKFPKWTFSIETVV